MLILLHLTSEICCDLTHALCLFYLEGTSAVAVSAGDTVGRPFLQCLIMLCCQNISLHRQIIIFVDQADIHPCRTGMAMSAVHALAHRVIRGKGTNDGIIPFLRGGIQIGQRILQLWDIPPARQEPSAPQAYPAHTGYTGVRSAPDETATVWHPAAVRH